ncbi:hypothetical protein [Novosphingobium olei]|uniref:hypothetical protein n=1 Tax=Novosphingobium olei TaxID=2728851 RepID=UPI00197D3FF4|nr:hypothetical protein [Novosphingobium olei]
MAWWSRRTNEPDASYVGVTPGGKALRGGQVDDPLGRHFSGYDLLVVVNLDGLNDKLRLGRYFFMDILKGGIVLHRWISGT